MNKTISYIIEIIWIVLFAACLIMGIVKTIQFGINYSYMFYILAAVALIMYLIRRRVRITQKKQ